jgi:hypothetical protein
MVKRPRIRDKDRYSDCATSQMSSPSPRTIEFHQSGRDIDQHLDNQDDQALPQSEYFEDHELNV